MKNLGIGYYLLYSTNLLAVKYLHMFSKIITIELEEKLYLRKST